MIMTEHTNETIQALRQNIRYFLKWTFISAISGVTIGLAGTLFGLGIQKATAFWKSHSWTLYLLPLVGLLIVWLYRFAHEEKTAVRIWSWILFPPQRRLHRQLLR